MENKELMQQVLDYLEQNVTPATFSSFISSIQLRELSETPPIAYLEVKQEFKANILKKRYIPLLSESFSKVTGKDFRVIIKTSAEYNDSSAVPSDNNLIRPFDLNVNFKKEKIFDPKFTFDNFIVGECNNYAAAASKAVAKHPSEIYNPLFLYGGSGLGKTHLMNAIGIYLLQHNPDLRVLYVSAETFTNDFIKSMLEDKSREFKNRYRKADVLLIDDIEFLEGKEQTQLEFFHTFNALYEENKQIIISSDRPPIKLTALDERLRSRFGYNMIADVQPPDFETRVAILHKKGETRDVPVVFDDNMDNIIRFIAENDKLKNNIRELEGAFNRVVNFSRIMGVEADLPFAKRILKDLLQGGNSITPEKIKSAVCKYYKIKISDIESETRKMTVAYPRQIAMYLCRTMTDYSFPKIGTIFGNKHHTTVKHACDKIEEDIKTDVVLKEDIEKLKEQIES